MNMQDTAATMNPPHDQIAVAAYYLWLSDMKGGTDHGVMWPEWYWETAESLLRDTGWEQNGATD